MARHTRRVPRDRHDRAQAAQRAAGLLDQLGRQADEVRQLEAAARSARTRLQQQILRHVDARELDITDMAKRTGISRQTIHRLICARRQSAQPRWGVGQRVAHPGRGPGTVLKVNGPALTIRFDRPDLGHNSQQVHAKLARITRL